MVANDVGGEDALGVTWHDASSFYNYYTSVGLNTCINNIYGTQCFALANDFWWNYARRAHPTGGLGFLQDSIYR